MIAPNTKNDPLMLKVDDVATLLAISTRQVFRLSDSGKMPRPLKLGGAVRWRRGDVEAWIAKGCPNCDPMRADNQTT
ncbi:MAG: helix-turn-helix transcriptional regulator [Pirellula sp.]|jgi:excisionase family DNA binding protein